MTNYTDFGQVVADLQGLIQALERVRQGVVTVSGIEYKSQDARQVALNGLQCDIGACGNWIRALAGLKKLCQEKYGGEWEARYRDLIGTGLSVRQAEDLMLDYLRNTLTTKIHFKIENLFGNILKALSASPRQRGFGHLRDTILREAGIPAAGREWDVLSVLANLRNSFHANGIHGNDSMSVSTDGLRFEFREGMPVECASWAHIIVIVRANIGVLECILASPAVSNHRSEIPDAFASRSP